MCDCNSDQEELIRLTQLRIRFYKILRDTDIKRKETMSLFSTLAFPAAKKRLSLSRGNYSYFQVIVGLDQQSPENTPWTSISKEYEGFLFASFPCNFFLPLPCIFVESTSSSDSSWWVSFKELFFPLKTQTFTTDPFILCTRTFLTSKLTFFSLKTFFENRLQRKLFRDNSRGWQMCKEVTLRRRSWQTRPKEWRRVEWTLSSHDREHEVSWKTL